MENANSKEYLEKVKIEVLENLRQTSHAPSVQSTIIPSATMLGGVDEDDDILADLDEDENPDVRMTEHRWDKKVTRDDELDESDDEEDTRQNGLVGARQNGAPKRRNIMDYQNPMAAPEDEDDVEMETMDSITTATVPQLDAIVAAAEANAEVNAEVMEQKSRSLTAVAAGEAGPSNAPSRSHSKTAHDNDGDVEMDEPSEETIAAAPEPQAPLSPADSVHAAPSAEPPAVANPIPSIFGDPEPKPQDP